MHVIRSYFSPACSVRLWRCIFNGLISLVHRLHSFSLIFYTILYNFLLYWFSGWFDPRSYIGEHVLLLIRRRRRKRRNCIFNVFVAIAITSALTASDTLSPSMIWTSIWAYIQRRNHFVFNLPEAIFTTESVATLREGTQKWDALWLLRSLLQYGGAQKAWRFGAQERVVIPVHYLQLINACSGQDLKRHEISHNEDKMFMCDYSKKAFHISTKLTRHLFIHSW